MSKTSKIKKQKTYALNLTKFELTHLRDLFSVVLPPELSKSISQALAEVENRQLVESMAWQKIAAACKDAKIPIGDDAPDYVVAPSASPPMSVFQLSSEPEEAAQIEQTSGFIDEGEDE